VGSRQISLNVPVAIPVYNGLENPVGGSGDFGDLQIGNLIGGDLPPGLSVVMANLSPEKDPFSLSRPGVSFQMKHGFKAMLWSLDIFRTPA